MIKYQQVLFSFFLGGGERGEGGEGEGEGLKPLSAFPFASQEWLNFIAQLVVVHPPIS